MCFSLSSIFESLCSDLVGECYVSSVSFLTFLCLCFCFFHICMFVFRSGWFRKVRAGLWQEEGWQKLRKWFVLSSFNQPTIIHFGTIVLQSHSYFIASHVPFICSNSIPCILDDPSNNNFDTLVTKS